MSDRCNVAVIGSGFAGSIMARVLTVIGHEVVLIERGTHPRFAIGESTTPLANLSLERLAQRYNLPDCYYLSAHGRWLEHHADVRRGLKRGFTFYRHHPGQPLTSDERLLVAASPEDAISDTHWLRADVDHHFVREAVAAGVDYRDRVELTDLEIAADGARLTGQRNGESFELRADFVVDASGPGGFLARRLGVPSGLERTHTRSGAVFSHFTDVRFIGDAGGEFPAGPYPDDWAAVHHLIDEGWMYSLRFDHGVTSAGFSLTPRGIATLVPRGEVNAAELWRTLLDRYPTIGAVFADARPVMPIAYRDLIQHRLTHAAGERWVMLPHAYAFVDPLFSTGIAWSLRAVERLALCFEGRRLPNAEQLGRYDALLAAEADQIDRVVAGAYEAMAHFDLFAAHAMLYFSTVSFAETRQRLFASDAEGNAWSGFLGVGDSIVEPLPSDSLSRLRGITGGEGHPGTPEQRRAYTDWIRDVIAPRNIGGFGEPDRQHLYPVDIDLLVERHGLLGLTREQLVAGLPAIRGRAPEPVFPDLRR